MNFSLVLISVVVIAQLLGHCSGLIDRLYCGSANCYEVLGVDRDVSAAEIRKVYRKLAIKYHPDKNKKKGAREKFEQISNAYEILKDEEERANYDYMLDHPEEVYSHYYRYYSRRTPKIDVRLVVAVTVLVISAVQYLSWWNSHRVAVDAAMKMQQYRVQAKTIAQSRGLLNTEEGKRKRKGLGGKDAKEVKAEEEAIIRSIVEENLNITGGYGKPRIVDVLLVQILISPYTLAMYLVWYAKWVWRFDIMKEPYGEEEKVYLTRKALKLSPSRWEALEESMREQLLPRELWVKKNHKEWEEEMKEEQKVKLADSAKHKKYRRYIKTHGKPSMTFAE